jgi:hypothetical protein
MKHPIIHVRGSSSCHFCGSNCDMGGGKMWKYEIREGIKTRVYYPACDNCIDAVASCKGKA